MAPADLETALEWAGRALAGFDAGAEGQYGPYTVEVGENRVLRRGSTIEIMWPAGWRVSIIGPDVVNDSRHVGKRGWAWQAFGEDAIRVVPDGGGWRHRAGLYPAQSIEEVA